MQASRFGECRPCFLTKRPESSFSGVSNNDVRQKIHKKTARSRKLRRTNHPAKT